MIRRLFDNRGNWVFIATVVAAYASAFAGGNWQIDSPRTIAAIVLGVIYSFIGTAGFECCPRDGSLRIPVLYFAVQIALVSAILYFSSLSGLFVIVILPLVSHSIMMLPRAGAATVCALLLLIFATIVGIQAPLSAVLQATLSVGAGMAFVVQLEAARTVLDSHPSRAADALSKAQSLAKEGLADVRRSVAALRASPMESRPLTEAVAALADECRTAGIRTDFSVEGAPRSLSPQAELTLYRATQEGLTNVRKHAHASHAEVVLDYADAECVRLVVKDNGVGGNKAAVGFGLVGVRERVQLLGGRVRVESGTGQGFLLEVELPTTDE